MNASELRVVLFSGVYTYVRDCANQALNRLSVPVLARGVQARVYSPTVAEPAFAPTGDLVDVPAMPLIGGRGEYRVAGGITRRVRRDLEAFAPNLVHVSAPAWLGHRAVCFARRRGLATLASLHTRFETYQRYSGLPLPVGRATG